MKRPPSRIALLALVAGWTVLHGLPATGQDSPESLLPPGFGDTSPPRAARPAPSAAPARSADDLPSLAPTDCSSPR